MMSAFMSGFHRAHRTKAGASDPGVKEDVSGSSAGSGSKEVWGTKVCATFSAALWGEGSRLPGDRGRPVKGR